MMGVVTPTRHVVTMMGAREKKKQAKRRGLAEQLCVEDVKALGGSKVIEWGRVGLGFRAKGGSCGKNGPPSTILSFSKGLGLGCGFLVCYFHMIRLRVHCMQSV